MLLCDTGSVAIFCPQSLAAPVSWFADCSCFFSKLVGVIFEAFREKSFNLLSKSWVFCLTADLPGFQTATSKMIEDACSKQLKKSASREVCVLGFMLNRVVTISWFRDGLVKWTERGRRSSENDSVSNLFWILFFVWCPFHAGSPKKGDMCSQHEPRGTFLVTQILGIVEEMGNGFCLFMVYWPTAYVRPVS